VIIVEIHKWWQATIKKMFYTSTAVYMYYVAICVFPQESPDDDLPGPKHVVNC
jgi:hypothetical protein